MFRVAQHFVTSLFDPFLPTALTANNQQPNERDTIPFDNPFFAAVRSGDAFGVSKYTLYKDFDPNILDDKGNSMLIWAASGGHLAVINILVNHGADLEHKGEGGYSALMFAIHHGHWRTVERLLGHGANPNVKYEGGDTALHTLARILIEEDALNPQLAQVDREIVANIVNALLQAGADLQIRNASGMTAAEVAEFCANNHMMMLLPQQQAPEPSPPSQEDVYGVQPMDLSTSADGLVIEFEEQGDQHAEDDGLEPLFQDPVLLEDLKDPICLPNGMTYSRATLQDLFARSPDGTILDPQTREVLTADVLQFKPNILIQQVMDRERTRCSTKRQERESQYQAPQAQAEEDGVREKRIKHFGRLFDNPSNSNEEEFENEPVLGIIYRG